QTSTQQSTVQPQVQHQVQPQVQEKKRVDWKNFRPRLSTNETEIKGLEPARYGMDRPEYNVHKLDVLYTIWCNSIRLLYTRGYSILPELANMVYNDYTLEYAQKYQMWIQKYGTHSINVDSATNLNGNYTKRLPDGK